jgi:hypothetical protein
MNTQTRAGKAAFFVSDIPATFTRHSLQFLGKRTPAARFLSLESF